jgi:small subunit ribosomal protein S4
LARYHESVCRFCRREGTKLFLGIAATRINALRRTYPPGQHGQIVQYTDYGTQLGKSKR